MDVPAIASITCTVVQKKLNMLFFIDPAFVYGYSEIDSMFFREYLRASAGTPCS
jgi:hypothetical protein